MRLLRLTSSIIASIFLLAIISLELTGNEHIFKAIANTYLQGNTGPSIDEFDIFEIREVESSYEIPVEFDDKYNAISPDEALIADIEKYNPAALLILKDGKILFDKYYDQYSVNSKTNSFSAAKSIVAISIGKCADLNLISSIDQKVIDIIPELKGPYREAVTIRHLLSMTSGINFNESYGDPFGFMAQAYYGDELLKKTFSYEATKEPGTEWKYLGGNTMIMSEIIRRVSGQNLSDFVSTHFWKPLGASQNALWNLDEKDGIEKAFCCFYSNALDFARVGQMILDSGIYNGNELLSRSFIEEMSKSVVLNDGSKIAHYGLQWWKIQYRSENIVYARGINGQYIIIIPELKIVIVRVGHKRGDKNEFNHPLDVYHYIDLAYQLTGQ